MRLVIACLQILFRVQRNIHERKCLHWVYVVGDFLFLQNLHIFSIALTLSWPAGHTRPTHKESFQVRWGNSISLFLHAATYLEVYLFHWTSQNAFSRETALYKRYCVQCCYFLSMLPSILKHLYSVEPVRMHFPAKQPCTRRFRGKMHSDWFNGIEILQGRWQHGEKVR
jgi:hypothetical protein